MNYLDVEKLVVYCDTCESFENALMDVRKAEDRRIKKYDIRCEICNELVGAIKFR